jgi:branched-subunit amino acid aminotransferase/4-amino-4-deoxychorismate lyase
VRVELEPAGAEHRADRAKAGGNYLSSYLISREAKSRGYAEGIGLDVDGRLSEGAGENLFLVKDGKLMTPPASSRSCRASPATA